MGIKEKDIALYWHNRALRYAKEGKWGPGAMTEEAHVAQVKVRMEFIDEGRGLRHFQAWKGLESVLDFGCGIGRYSHHFDPRSGYLGVDIAMPHLEIAAANNPAYQYLKINTPTFEDECDFEFDIFFTATVLQHCSDNAVDAIFANVAKKRAGGFAFSLYEFANPDSKNKQTAGRTPDEYIDMAAKHFTIAKTVARHHTIHGAVHAHTMIYVEPLDGGD